MRKEEKLWKQGFYSFFMLLDFHQYKTILYRLIDGRAKYYELGGIGGCRAKSWNEWCSLIHDSETTRIREGQCDGWTDKHLYLGPDYEELWDEHYCPKPAAFAGASLQDIKYKIKVGRYSIKNYCKI